MNRALYMDARKNKTLRPYVYIRLDDETREQVKEAARKDGSNMTIWIRQLIKRELTNV
jgi:hypothetical protein